MYSWVSALFIKQPGCYSNRRGSSTIRCHETPQKGHKMKKKLLRLWWRPLWWVKCASLNWFTLWVRWYLWQILFWDLSLLAPAKMIFSSPPFETIETENVLHLAFNWPQKTNQSRGLMMIDTVLSRKSSWRSGKLLDWMCVSRIFLWMAYINVLMAMRESPGFENNQICL